MRGEDLAPARLAADCGVSTKSITRNINEIKEFLAENRELVGHAELEYSYANKAYRFFSEEFLSDRELFAVAKVLIGSRAFSESDASLIIGKLKRFASPADRKKLDEIIRKELYHYSPVKHDCENVIENLWRLIGAIAGKKEITVSYYKKERTLSEKRIRPVSLMFSEYYFYLIAYYPGRHDEPRYFRVDRITGIVEHRERSDAERVPDYDGEHRRHVEQIPSFDEGALRKRNQFMFYGKMRRIRFWYTGPSVQAILDKLPTAKIIERGRGKHLLEAEVYGDGIRMFLLSQGAWVRVVAPEEFVREMGTEIEKMGGLYEPP
jgi:predicted DNA-binding transcriptional regulator YafY